MPAAQAAITDQVGEAVALPDTPAGRRMAAYLEALNTGSLEVMRTFMAEHFDMAALQRQPAEARALRSLIFYDNCLGLVPRRVLESREDAIGVLAQARLTGEWATLFMGLNPDPPRHIATFHGQPANRPADLAPARALSDEALAAEVGAFLEKRAAADVFSGAVLVARGDAVIFEQAYGLASKSFGVPNTPDTRFNVGSMYKMLTGVAICQLVEAGKLDFGDLVGQVLPDYPADVADRVTIHHLLTHTSGMDSYWNEKFEALKARTRSIQDYVRLFVDEPLTFEPGQRYQYSNNAFVLLGAIVEAVAGQRYEEYLHEHIIQPAGMTRTGLYEVDMPVERLAEGYTHIGMDGLPHPGPRRSNLFLHVVKGNSAGGGFSTARDLLAFSRALMGHKLLSPAMTDTLLRGKVETGEPGERYAYGFFDLTLNDQRIVGHSGTFPGIGTQLDIFPARDMTAVVLCNYDPHAAQVVVNHLRDVITQQIRIRKEDSPQDQRAQRNEFFLCALCAFAVSLLAPLHMAR